MQNPTEEEVWEGAGTGGTVLKMYVIMVHLVILVLLLLTKG